MNTTINFKASDRLEKFIKWIDNRSKDSIHKDNIDLIERFKEKVLMIELERLKKNDVTLPETIEVPDNTFPDRKNNICLEVTRSGNGHTSEKIRDLYDNERDIIRAEFMKLNGQIKEDACLEIQKKLGTEVAIFQVTGFVTYLHLQIAEGKFEVNNMPDYLMFLQEHRNRWATYNSPKYRTKRIENQAA